MEIPSNKESVKIIIHDNFIEQVNYFKHFENYIDYDKKNNIYRNLVRLLVKNYCSSFLNVRLPQRKQNYFSNCLCASARA